MSLNSFKIYKLVGLLFDSRYLKDRKLTRGDRVGMRSSVEPDGQLVSLELTDLKLDDAGQVKVVAVNSEGDASTAARLTVIGK